MRQRMVRLGHADLRVRAGALFLADHERDDARQVGLKRQELQVQHQRQVIFEDRRHALRLLHRRQLDVALFLGFLNAPFDVTNRFGVFVDLDLILRSELPLEARQLLRHRIQNALVLPQPRFPRRALRAAAVAKQLLEHRPRVVLHRQRLRRAAPRDACACRRNSGLPVHAPALAGASIASSSDATCVSLANCLASSWSIDTSAMISTSFRPPRVVPVRNDPEAPAWM